MDMDMDLDLSLSLSLDVGCNRDPIAIKLDMLTPPAAIF